LFLKIIKRLISNIPPETIENKHVKIILNVDYIYPITFAHQAQKNHVSSITLLKTIFYSNFKV